MDKNSGQYKAPFNQIKNEARVFTYKDTAIVTPNSDTPYSLCWLDLRAEPHRAVRPGGGEEPLLLGACSATATPSTTATSAAAPPATKPGDYLVAGPDWKGETPAGIKKVFRSTTQFSLADLPHPALQSGGHAERGQDPVRLQSAAALGLSQTAGPPAAPAINFPKINKGLVKTNFFEYLDFALQFAPPGPEEKEIRAKLASIGIGAGKNFDFKALASSKGRSRSRA